MNGVCRGGLLRSRGHAAFGVMCAFPSPPVVEMLGHLGFDWILPDNEHGSITVDTAEACIVAAELSGMTPIVARSGTYRARFARMRARANCFWKLRPV